MKRILISILLSYTLMATTAFSGEKIKFINSGFICEKKDPRLFSYNIILTLAISQGSKAIQNVRNVIGEQTNEECQVMVPALNSVWEIVKKQKSEFNGVIYDYIKIKVLSMNGEDYSKKNMFYWAVSPIDEPLYEIVK